MTNEMIVRAWKDPEYRATLSAEDRAHLPACPPGTPLSGLEDGPVSGLVGVHVGKDGIAFMAPTCSIRLTQKDS